MSPRNNESDKWTCRRGTSTNSKQGAMFAMCNRETEICYPDEQTGKILKLHEGPHNDLQVHKSVADRERPHQVDTIEMATQRPY